MRVEYIPVNDLRPAQWSTRSSLCYLLNNFSADKFDPVPVVEVDGNQILTGGHNRAYVAWLTSQVENVDLSIKSFVIESDDDMRNYSEKYFAGLSISTFKTYYHNFLRDKRGIVSAPQRLSDLGYIANHLHAGRNIILSGRKAFADTKLADEDIMQFLGNVPKISDLVDAVIVR